MAKRSYSQSFLRARGVKRALPQKVVAQKNSFVGKIKRSKRSVEAGGWMQSTVSKTQKSRT